MKKLVRTGILALTLCCPTVAPAQVACSDPPTSPCGLPAEFGYLVTVEELGIEVTFASLRQQYGVGDPIEFELLFENVASSEFCMNWQLSPLDFVFVLPPGYDSLADAPLNDLPWMYPSEPVFGAGPGLALSPGECRAFHYEWNPGVEPGTYAVLAGLFEPTFDAHFGDFRLPTSPLRLTITLGPGVPVSGDTTGMLKARYRSP
jgi:hypothetical protein